MVDSKTVAIIVLLAVVAFGGGINYVLEKVSGSSAAGTFENPTGFVTKYFSGDGGKELRIYASLKFDKAPALDVKVSDPMKTFSIDYTDADAKVALGSFSVNSPAPVQMEFREYDGTVFANSGILSFSGTSGQVKYNSQYLEQAGAIKVKADSMKFSRIELAGIPRTALHFSNMTGNITITDGESQIITHTIADRDITLDIFRGKIILAGDAIILDGTGNLKTSILLAPGR